MRRTLLSALRCAGRSMFRGEKDATVATVEKGQDIHGADCVAYDVFYAALPHRCNRRAVLLQLEGILARPAVVVGCRQLRHRNGIPPSADAPRVQDAQVD